MLSKFQESSFGKVKENLFTEFKECFLEPKFLFLP